LHLQPEPEAPYGAVDEVLAVTKRAHVAKMGFVGNEAYEEAFCSAVSIGSRKAVRQRAAFLFGRSGPKHGSWNRVSIGRRSMRLSGPRREAGIRPSPGRRWNPSTGCGSGPMRRSSTSAAAPPRWHVNWPRAAGATSRSWT